MKKNIYKECLYLTRDSILLSLVYGNLVILTGLLATNTVSRFTDAVFNQNWQLAINSTYVLIVYLFIIILVIPALEYLSNINLLKNSLCHERVIIKRLLNKRYQSVINIEKGELQSKIDTDLTDFRYNLIDIVTNTINIPIGIVYLIIFCKNINNVFVITSFCIMAVNLVAPLVLRSILTKCDLKMRDYNIKIRNSETNVIQYMYVYHMFKLDKLFYNYLNQEFLNNYKMTEKRNIFLNNLYEKTTVLLNDLSYISIIFIGAFLVSKHFAIPGDITKILGYISIFKMLFNGIASIIKVIPLQSELLERISLFYNEAEKTQGVQIKKFNSLNTENLSFAYEKNKPILKKLNLNISKAKKNLIIGKNGVGKTTLVNIMTGFLLNYSGTVKINGINIQDINISSWRSCYAYAPQIPYLFNGSIIENIILNGDETFELYKLMKDFNIYDIRNRMITQNGKELSGGEKQKISILRAFFSNRDVMILDEPSNNLDKDSIDELCSFIKESDKTFIIITHDKYIIDNLPSNVILL